MDNVNADKVLKEIGITCQTKKHAKQKLASLLHHAFVDFAEYGDGSTELFYAYLMSLGLTGN